MIKCRIIRAYGPYRVGQIIEPSGVVRDELRRRGFIEIIPDAPVEMITAHEDEVRCETAVIKRRGRPRKGVA